MNGVKVEFFKAGGKFYTQILTALRQAQRITPSQGQQDFSKLVQVQISSAPMLAKVFHPLLFPTSIQDMLLLADMLLLPTPSSQLCQKVLLEWVQICLCNFHPQVLILSLGTTQKVKFFSCLPQPTCPILEKHYRVSQNQDGQVNNSPLKNDHIPQIIESTTFYGKKGLADVTELRISMHYTEPLA